MKIDISKINMRVLFYLLLGLLVAYFIYFAIAISLSIKEDLQGRGFVKCTDILMMELDICTENATEGDSFIKKSNCYISSVFNNSYCDTKVIFTGYQKWFKGEISKPWDEYIFEPITEFEDPLDFQNLDLTKSESNNPSYEDFIKIEKSLKETLKSDD